MFVSSRIQQNRKNVGCSCRKRESRITRPSSFSTTMRRTFARIFPTLYLLSRKGLTCIWALWLLLATFVTNLFSAAFSSNYMFQPIYTKNRTLDFLLTENVTMFIAYDDMDASLGLITGQLHPNYVLDDGIQCLRNYMYYDSFVHHQRRACGLVAELFEMRDGEYRKTGQSPPRSRDITFLRRKLMPIALLGQIMQVQLLQPGTLFLTPKRFADAYWGYFREAIRSDKAIRFALQPEAFAVDDGRLLAYGYTKGLPPWHQAFIPWRLKSIASGGLLGLWRKREELKTRFNKSSHWCAGFAIDPTFPYWL